MATVLLEARPYRPFKSSEEYLYAMREDLAEWMNIMYPELLINVDNFMDRLDTGIALCKHANNVRQAAEEYVIRRQARCKSMTKSMTTGLAGPILSMGNVHYLPAAKSGTFFARDNVSNFISWCRKSLKIFECLLFETDDLILRKNEKHVILCLLEVARRGAKFGMLAPMLVQMERQIDREIAADNKANGVGCQTESGTNTMTGTENELSEESDSEEENDDDDGPMLMYGPQPQIITNDLKSLDEMVRDLVEKCTCPSQFPMIRVSEGKYRIGDTKVLIFVRILRSHVMVRVGGGWDTLSHYLDKHDPCRCRAQHRSSLSARLISKTGNNGIELHKAQVVYERSPPTPRKMNENISQDSKPNIETNEIRPRNRSPVIYRNKVDKIQTPEKTASPKVVRRSMSPNPRQLDVRKRQQSIDTTSTTKPSGVHFDSTSFAVNEVPAELGSESVNKYENVSDNGSEISDEGYRSLGIIQSTGNNAEKRISLYSQASNEDADNSAHLEQNSTDSQEASLDGNNSKTTTDNTPTSDDLTGKFEETDKTLNSNNNDTLDVISNKFEKSGVFITDTDITVDIASTTGLRRTDFSNQLFDKHQSPKKGISKIPKSPVAVRRKSIDNTVSENNTGLPLSRKIPQYRSVRKSSGTVDMTRDPMNTWSGRANKTRPSISTETFEAGKPKSPNTFNRNAPSRSSQYDKSPAKTKSTSNSVNTSPNKSRVTSPLAQQLLQAANCSKNDTQILEKMKEILSKYSTSNKIQYNDDFTTAWVNNNGALESNASTSPRFPSKRPSVGSTCSEIPNHRDIPSVASPRRTDKGVSKIPAPIRSNTGLY